MSIPPRKIRGQTYCPRLWEEIHVDHEGRVYACVCPEAVPFGDIYKTPLSKICNSKAVQALRKLSLNGALKCYARCHLLNKAAIAPPPAAKPLKIAYSGLKQLNLRFGESCNIRCLMCTQAHVGGRTLDVESLKRNLDLGPFQNIAIEGGEPLFIEAAKKFFDHAASQGKTVSFLSNGMLINDEWAQKIVRNSLFIYISINAATKETHELVNRGSKWKTVLGNIRRLNKYRKAFHSETVIHGHMTLVRENLKEAALFMRKYKAFGFDRICFSHAESAVKHLHENVGEIITLKNGIEAAYRSSKSKADIDRSGLKPLFEAALQYPKKTF